MVGLANCCGGGDSGVISSISRLSTERVGVEGSDWVTRHSLALICLSVSAMSFCHGTATYLQRVGNRTGFLLRECYLSGSQMYESRRGDENPGGVYTNVVPLRSALPWRNSQHGVWYFFIVIYSKWKSCVKQPSTPSGTRAQDNSVWMVPPVKVVGWLDNRRDYLVR